MAAAHNLPTVTDMMAAYAQDAVAFARDKFNITLDFSEASLTAVEHILATLHHTIPHGWLVRLYKRGPTPDEIQQMAKMFGGYLGEIMRQTMGGAWHFTSEVHTVPTITLRLADASEIYPAAKVYQRLTNGAEESITAYYAVIKQQVAAGRVRRKSAQGTGVEIEHG